MSEERYWHCPKCDGTNIDCKEWVLMNSSTDLYVQGVVMLGECNSVCTTDESDYWCHDCKEHLMPIMKPLTKEKEL